MPFRQEVRRLTVLTLVVGVAASAAWVGSAAAAERNMSVPFRTLLPAPEGAAFFIPPTPIPGKPGEVIWARRSTEEARDFYGVSTSETGIRSFGGTGGKPVQSQLWHVLYHSTDRNNRSIAVAAMMVFDPVWAANAPVTVAMHGWTGFGDQCGVFGSPMRAGLANLPVLFWSLLGQGGVFVIPDASGLARTDYPTTMVAADGARLLLDAGRAARSFLNTSNRVLYHGLSLGATMVLGVGSEAATYAPDLDVRGVVSVSGSGHSGAGSAVMDMEKNKESRNSDWYSRSVAYLLMLEQSFSKVVVNSADYLTPKAQSIVKRAGDVCGGDLSQMFALMKWEDIFKKDPQPIVDIDPGTIAGTSKVPTYFLVGKQDFYVDPLMPYHAYRSLCSKGQPAWWQELDGDHGGVGRQALDRTIAPTSLLRDWMTQALNGTGPTTTPCADPGAVISPGVRYTGRYLARATNTPLPAGTSVRLESSGSCKVRKNVLETAAGDRCLFKLTFVSKKGKTVASASFAVRVRSNL